MSGCHVASCGNLSGRPPFDPRGQRRQRPSRSLSAQRRLQRSQTMDTTIAPPALNLGCAQEARWHSGGLGDILNLTFEVGKGVHGGHDRQLFFHCCDPHAPLGFGFKIKNVWHLGR